MIPRVASKPASLTFDDERILLRVLAGLRPALWSGLRQLSRRFKRSITNDVQKAALDFLYVLEASENLCSRLDLLADGACVVLAPGRHRWVGKCRGKRLRIFGLPGAMLRGRVHLVEGSSGTFYDVKFENKEAGAVRAKQAAWKFDGCDIECVDQDAFALLSLSSKIILNDCRLTGSDGGNGVKTCWIAIAAKGDSDVSAARCKIGPGVRRGVVVTEQANLSLSGCEFRSCEEIAVRFNDNADVLVNGTRFDGGCIAFHVGNACTGSFALRDCSVSNFHFLWGSEYQPALFEAANTKFVDCGDSQCKDVNDLFSLEDAAALEKILG
eukprot:TRINITY_DN4511_c1_g1_i1.p1 TRINITY_DN4511_c1_g1~~TRINITY_DN4511_c1_g1_i1.p1  ORF type:complete len:326 (-),score=52.59 TRINITY_DN4511_c1_g1_i1:126-1103(-)